MPCVSVIMDRLSGDLPIYYSALTWAYYTMLRFCLTQHQHKPPVVDPLIDGLACWVAGCPPPSPPLVTILRVYWLSRCVPHFLPRPCLYTPSSYSLRYALSVSLCFTHRWQASPFTVTHFQKLSCFTSTVAQSTSYITSGQRLFFHDRGRILSTAEEYTESIRDLLQPGQADGAPWIIFKLGSARP